jgi:CheY-like chemotaxis protein
MRTPMNAIIGMSSIGIASGDVERMQYSLKRINEASQHLLGIINDILDMSKIEADKFELSFVETNFEHMLQKVINVVNFRVQEKKQNLFVNIDQGIPAHIIADEQRLAQVVTNLLTNAVKFTPEGGSITLRAEKTAETEETCTILVEVKDTGIGISAEQQKKLFSLFEQADGSISRRFGGTGLGLAISKRMIELMGGRIWVESEIDKGSSFLFELEAKKGEARDHGSQRDFSDLRMVIAADAPETLELFAGVLSPLGVHCETAINGGAALEAIGAKQEDYFHIIFLDMNLPDMTGIELAKLIIERGTKSALVLMTSDESGNMENEARSVGISAFLRKPLLPSTLIDCINTLTGTPSVAEAGEEASIDGIFDGKTILIAEDVDINREIIEALLESTGVSIDFAVDGEDAVNKFTSPNNYQLILMDLHMPNVDGLEATRRIRSIEESRRNNGAIESPSETPKQLLEFPAGIPIIAMTANVFREDVERCLAAGMNGHLGKPVEIDKVISTLSRYLV